MSALELMEAELGAAAAKAKRGGKDDSTLSGAELAVVVKFADNVLKTYATAVAILLTCMTSAVTTGVPPTAGFLSGMGLVLLSMLLYNNSCALGLRSLRRTGGGGASR